jgi:signal transduction histidine kinase
MAPLWETTAPFALFMFATVFTAWYAGVGPGIVTGAFGIASRLYFDLSGGDGRLTITWEEAIRLTLFAGFVVGSAIALTRMRDDRRQLESSIEAARREIEERRRVEADLVKARAAAESANRLKDEFLGLVSHELRTPLNAILGWVALMKSGGLTPDRSAYALEIIQKNAKSQAQTIADLIDIARSLTGQMLLEPALIELNMVVQSAVESSRAATDVRGIRLSLALDGRPLLVWGDLARLQQIVGNLLSNAIKFTPDGGGIDVSLGVDDGRARLVILNSGDGIEPAFAPHLFEPFQQGESGSTRRYGGLGLGLALVRQLVELHGGSVEGAAAGPDGGARFVVLLPLRDASPDTGDAKAGLEAAG